MFKPDRVSFGFQAPRVTLHTSLEYKSIKRNVKATHDRLLEETEKNSFCYSTSQKRNSRDAQKKQL